MEEIYAALLLHRSGSQVNEENLKKVLHSAGAKVDEAKAKALVAALDGINIEDAIKEAATVSVAPATQQQAPAEKKEEKKEEKREDPQAAAGLGALFS